MLARFVCVLAVLVAVLALLGCGGSPNPYSFTCDHLAKSANDETKLAKKIAADLNSAHFNAQRVRGRIDNACGQATNTNYRPGPDVLAALQNETMFEHVFIQ